MVTSSGFVMANNSSMTEPKKLWLNASWKKGSWTKSYSFCPKFESLYLGFCITYNLIFEFKLKSNIRSIKQNECSWKIFHTHAIVLEFRGGGIFVTKNICPQK